MIRQHLFIEGEVVLITLETLKRLIPNFIETGEYARLAYLVENAMPDAAEVEVLIEGFDTPVMVAPHCLRRMPGRYL
jgi:hypothetical protein